MGYNTTVVVMNDALDQIRFDKDFGRKLAEAIMGLSLGDDPKTGRPYRSQDVSALNHLNAATVIEQHHASGNAIVAVGGNHATVIGHSFGTHHNPEDRLKIVKELASQLGYSLRRKANVL